MGAHRYLRYPLVGIWAYSARHSADEGWERPWLPGEPDRGAGAAPSPALRLALLTVIVIVDVFVFCVRRLAAVVLLTIIFVVVVVVVAIVTPLGRHDPVTDTVFDNVSIHLPG